MMEKKKLKFTPGKRDPKSPKETFLSLTSRTYPHGHEEEVLDLLPSLDKDQFGNYYLVVGEKPTTMFTSHFDTADHRQNDVVRFTYTENGDEFVCTDGNTILGADDKAGVTVMLYMIANGVPGIYYFFIGEERGGIGSKALASEFKNIEVLNDVVRCVSFDRRNYGSVITMQLGKQCCSSQFAKALSSAYTSLGLDMSPDPTGIFTDSAMMMAEIPECTNVSVGYFDEHTGRERQNLSFLERLCRASVSLDWNSLPTSRDLSVISDSSSDIAAKKHKHLLDVVKNFGSYSGYELDETFNVYFDVEGWPVDQAVQEIKRIKTALKDIDTVRIDNGYIIVEL